MSKLILTPSIYDAINDALPFGYWKATEADLNCIELDARIATATLFEQNFKNKITSLEKNLKEQSSDTKGIIDELSLTFNIIYQQLDWAIKIRDINKVLFYSNMVHIVLPAIIRSISLMDDEFSNKKSLSWMNRRIETGGKIVDFLKGVQNEISKNKGNSTLLNEVGSCLASTLVDHIALPQLIPKKLSDSNLEGANNALQNALAILKNLPEILINDFSTSYWISKAYRHLAMANIKIGKQIRALLLLSISSIFLRYLEGEVFSEINQERLRGYAELFNSINKKNKALNYLKKTNYTEDRIGKYIPEVKARDIKKMRLNICLIRHGEKDSDATKVFGFTDNPTSKGMSQQSSIVKGLSKIIDDRYSRCKIFASELLNDDAKSIIRDLRSSVDTDKRPIELVSSEHWNPINVGDFSGLDESQAKIKFPGEYQQLMDYRYNKNDGFNVNFPGGESVLEFEQRISIALAELIYELAMNTDDDQIEKYLDKTLFVIFGHTSTLTACLNIFAYFDIVSLRKSEYKFYPIETGTIIYGAVDLLNHEIDFEARQPLLL